MKPSSALAMVLILALAACSSPGTTESPASTATPAATADVEQALASGIGGVGITLDPDSLACSDSGTVTKGDVVECDFTNNGQPVRLVAEVLSVNGTAIEFDVRTEARPVPPDTLARAVALRASQQLGGKDVSATCASELPPTVGAAVACTLSSDGDELDVQIVVDTVEGGRIDWRLVTT